MENDIFDYVYEEFLMMCPWARGMVREWHPGEDEEIVVVLKDGSVILYDGVLKSFRSFIDISAFNRGRAPVAEERWKREFAMHLYRTMKLKGYTQNELAMDTGLSQTTISKYINGTSTPTVYNLVQIARAMNCTEHELARMLCYI